MGSSGGVPAAVLALAASQLIVGQETFSRDSTDFAWGGPTTNVINLTYFRARKSGSITSIRVGTGDQAAAATPTLCKMGLFSIAANGDGTRVAVTDNDTALFATTYTRYSKNWLSPYSVVAGQWYAQAVLTVSAGATPHFVGGSPGVLSAETAEDPPLAMELGAMADIPASFVVASLTQTSYRIYGVVF